MFEVSRSGLQFFNFIIMAFVAVGAMWVFPDTRKQGLSYASAVVCY